MNFCSHCGSDKLSFTIPRHDNRYRYVCDNCATIHYSNPKIVAGCLPIWEDKVLLCKRAIPPRYGFWNVPGGYLENGETVEEGARREVREEALTEVEITGLHAIFSIPQINQVYIHFLGRLRQLQFGEGEESLEVRLFSEEEIPWPEIAFASSVFTLQNYFEDRSRKSRQVHLGAMPDSERRGGYK